MISMSRQLSIKMYHTGLGLTSAEINLIQEISQVLERIILKNYLKDPTFRKYNLINLV